MGKRKKSWKKGNMEENFRPQYLPPTDITACPHAARILLLWMWSMLHVKLFEIVGRGSIFCHTSVPISRYYIISPVVIILVGELVPVLNDLGIKNNIKGYWNLNLIHCGPHL